MYIPLKYSVVHGATSTQHAPDTVTTDADTIDAEAPAVPFKHTSNSLQQCFGANDTVKVMVFIVLTYFTEVLVMQAPGALLYVLHSVRWKKNSNRKDMLSPVVLQHSISATTYSICRRSRGVAAWLRQHVYG